MSMIAPRPLIGVTACLKQRDESFFHSVQRKYVDAVIDGTGGMPVLLPAIGDRQDVDGLLDRLGGLMLTGSPSNVGPDYYGGPQPRDGNQADPDRDATTLPLARRAIERGIPLFAVCRGIQELNVALGGTLHQHLHELSGRRDHRSDKSKPHAQRYEPCHPVRLTPGGLMQRICEGASTIEVNSLHGQGIDRLATGLRVEAVAEDGTIEAVSLPEAGGFVLGVQWHPEALVSTDRWSRRLFAAFGEAARAFEATRAHHDGFQRVA
jgi:putative glutamine amidotransferase